MSLRLIPRLIRVSRVSFVRDPQKEFRYLPIFEHDDRKHSLNCFAFPFEVTSTRSIHQSRLISNVKQTIRTPADLWRWINEESSVLLARRGKGARFRHDQVAKREKERLEANATSSSSGDGEDDKDSPRMPTDEEKKRMQEALKRLFAIALFLYGCFILFKGPEQTGMYKDTTWSDFTTKLLPTGQVSKLVVFPERDVAFIYTYGGARGLDGTSLSPMYKMGIPSLARFEAEVRAAETALHLPPEKWTQIEYKRLEGIAGMIGLAVVFVVLTLGYFAFKRAKVSFNPSDMMSSLTKVKFNILDPTTKGNKLKIKFKDVAGLHEAKVEIKEFVDYLKHSGKYTRLGARLPKGALLTGPPGCGKTLLAKALAAESSVPFISMNGTEFIEMIGGLGASRIRDLFKEAKKRSPCIIYIDEIDAIGRKRSEGGKQFGGSSGEEEQTLNQLLVEMDGMDTNQGVILIASTNRPDILDKALLRPGRFDRHISVDLPTVLERQELFEMYLRKVKTAGMSPNLIQRLAHLTPGFTGADINNVVNEAAIHAATNHQRTVGIQDLSYAMEKIIAGPEKRSRVLVQEEKEIVAYHESGHALVGWLLEHTDALLKVTIVPRTSAALGFAQYTPRDRKLFTQEELFDRMCMMLGGRAAENVIFGRITTGAQNDLEKVTQQAYNQVKKYGMSKLIGPISFAPQPGEERSSQFAIKPYSKKLGQVIDEEVKNLVGKAYFFTEQLLRDNDDKLQRIAKALLERESLSYEDVKQLIGAPKYGDKNVVDIVDQILPKDNDE